MKAVWGGAGRKSLACKCRSYYEHDTKRKKREVKRLTLQRGKTTSEQGKGEVAYDFFFFFLLFMFQRRESNSAFFVFLS